ncbi:transglutaminase family protein [Parasphingopyxis algicola]|uniref:transglutaminase family protein n=1 Tax=Parasphingopyxis algicola TaxID=2026624 RepID=UPI0015A469BF|nr:transglutaminase family protein [Parasphingopyxis algicola]QLC26186.1 transglutaminase family protein [Parasphingopyxis algicola]
MRLCIDHRTDYTFSEPQRRLVQLLRVTPVNFAAQHVVSWHIDVDCDARLRGHRDGFGNRITMLYIDGPIEKVALRVSGEVLTDDRSGMIEDASETLPAKAFLRPTNLSRADEAIRTFATDVAAAKQDPLERMHLLMSRLLDQIRFEPTLDAVERDAATAFAANKGVCQDHAHIFCAAARAMGIPARYISGHLFRRDGAEQQEASHAWAEACLPSIGWTGFDPANGISPDDAYVRVACGLDYRDAAPVAGRRMGGGDEALAVDVRVTQARDQTQN